MKISPPELKAKFEALIGAERVSADAEKNQAYASDWTKSNTAVPKLVLFPGSTFDVVQIVKLANQLELKLIPSGGRTGLAGGVSVLDNEIAVSLEKMDRILEHDPIDNFVRAEAGVITQALQDFAKKQGMALPLDLAARGSSQIGGNIASNAGGLNVIRNGMIRKWVAGLRVVTGSGEELNLQANLVKDNSGYNLIQSFIGSEGTLGIITEVSIWLTQPAADTKVLAFASDDLASTMQVYVKLRDTKTLQAFEIFDNACYELVINSFSLKPVFPLDKKIYAVIEFEAFKDWEDRITEVLGEVPDPLISDSAIIGHSEGEKAHLWSYRERIAEAVVRNPHYQTDVSVRTSRIFDFMDRLNRGVAEAIPEVEFLGFGHLGDGNLHAIALRPADATDGDFALGREKFGRLLLTLLKEMDGSFSAEHGVGILKKAHMKEMKSPYEMELHRQIKKMFDPKAILNPKKILD